jgi:hypothetical protein
LLRSGRQGQVHGDGFFTRAGTWGISVWVHLNSGK